MHNSLKEDPTSHEFWKQNAQTRLSERGMLARMSVPPSLTDFLAAEPPGLRVLIPGCGSGYEVRAFTEHGHDVLAIDFASTAIKHAQLTLGSHAHLVQLADFFNFDYIQQFDLVYDRYFLCSIPRSQWLNYASRMTELIRPEGRLVGSFLFLERIDGPPYGLKQGDLELLLDQAFERTADFETTDPTPILISKKRWQVWTRR